MNDNEIDGRRIADTLSRIEGLLREIVSGKKDKMKENQIVTCQMFPIDIYVVSIRRADGIQYHDDYFYGIPLDDPDVIKDFSYNPGAGPDIYGKDFSVWPMDEDWKARDATDSELLKATGRCKVEFYREYLKKLLKSRLEEKK